MSAHHLTINLDKTELLFLPGKCPPTHDLTITFDNSVLAPTQTAGNLGVTLDSQLSLTANITATTRSCRFMLHNIRRIRPLLTQKAAQVLVQALVISCLDYCNSLLAGPPAGAIRPLQLIQNAAAQLVSNLSSLTLLRSSAIGLLLPHCELNTHQNHYCLLSWLINIPPPPQTKNTSLPTIPLRKKNLKKIVLS